ncbi:hypothetical protein A2771_02360 [Candidatus Woesebacteria bacterium RIFCSPHIGHO2_01_FULL_38_26b]|uniref:Glycosyl transferase family 1 domain-containing protein n=1 Tax=Candidatus Woesebacteria bacterium RIFCSPHIGHO2_01_FULL_38_26b TaxID=1802491 RepID=A0A1F7XZG7_9BACT|nr:MAG: hypothetical protein A2771_02360 [Candidatus Woesebacteria bacterium RIFCSPHIGHO2_01_FULL_38_26b]
MRAAIYNPYLDTLGGGEKYTIDFASVFIKAGFKVDIQWKNKSILEKLETRFGVKLDGVNVVDDIKRGDGCDICFWLSDGSIPLLRARKNFLHFQFPFKDTNGKSLLNRMKLVRINRVICNSKFTKSFVDKEYGIDSLVIYPSARTEKIKPKRKENIILFVGRFSRLTQLKRQDVLIEVFKKFVKRGYEDWKLILVGGVEIGADEYLEGLYKSSKNYPIEIIKSPSYKELISIYGKARLFWSASGYGVDEIKMPLKIEHFGISIVEAMSGGAVPLVYKAGGPKEIIVNGVNGYLWKTKNELLKSTQKLINNTRLMSTISSQAKKDSKFYGYEKFEKEILALVQK